jgi:hypothetical protein
MAKRTQREHYIAVRGRATYRVKALNREAALEQAEARLQRDIERGRKSFPDELVERWVGMAGMESEEIRKGEEVKESELNFAWKNAPQGQWRTGGDKKVTKHGTRLDEFDPELSA